MSIQVLGIFYLLFFLVFQLTSPTTAYFSDLERNTGSISAAKDFGDDGDGGEGKHEGWGKSSLNFNAESCDAEGVKATVKNGGSDMNEDLRFEVWWNDKGSPKPKKGGTKLHSGTKEPLKAEGTVQLEFQPTKEGKYMFRAYQESGHPGKGELWSEGMMWKCNSVEDKGTEKEELKEKSEQGKKDESKSTQGDPSDQDSNTEDKLSNSEKENEVTDPGEKSSKSSDDETSDEPEAPSKTKTGDETESPDVKSKTDDSKKVDSKEKQKEKPKSADASEKDQDRGN